MLQFAGLKLLTFSGKAAIRRGGQKLPTYGERWFYVKYPRAYLLVEWTVREGYRLHSIRVPEGHTLREIESWSYQVVSMAMKRRQTEGDLPPIPALSMETVLFKKLPLVVEFLCATAYEDGSLRTPGYYTVRNRGVEFEVTFYDPDAGMRLPVRHREHDKAWLTAEALLGVSDAPWEFDKYLWEKRPKEKKKKK